MSLLAEQTYGWQIYLIRKLLAFASFPAPESVFYDLPFASLVISKCAAYQPLDSIDDSRIAKQVCLMTIL